MTPQDLIEQVRSMHLMQLQCGATVTTRGLALTYGIGRLCRRNRWPGVRRGPLRECFANATHMAIRSDRWVYCEGYALRPALGVSLGEHAWVLDAANEFEVVDPTWRNTRDGVYLGIPFDYQYLCRVLQKQGVYGLLTGDGIRPPDLLRQNPQEWLHRDAASIPRDFVVE